MNFSNSQFRSAPKLMPCAACGIETVHHETPSGSWVCWCDEAVTADADIRIIQERRDAILQAMEEGQVQPSQELTKELAELEAAIGRGVQ
jgi:hypothetical protein